MIDDVRVYNAALTEAEIEDVKKGPLPAGLASKPLPGDGVADVPRDVTLSWTVGKDIVTHDVYLGTSLADVNNAGRTGPAGLLVSQGQAANTFGTTSLAFGQTYYWRVDGLSAVPGSAPLKGAVWSFTVEPYAYPIAGVKVTASGAQVGMEAENTVNGSGLGADDLHSTEPGQMWLSTGVPSWIQYEFDQVYKLQELWVWNSNQLLETGMGFGARNVTIEYSLDGSYLDGIGRGARVRPRDGR